MEPGIPWVGLGAGLAMGRGCHGGSVDIQAFPWPRFSFSPGPPAVERGPADRKIEGLAVQSSWGTCQGSEESGLGLEEVVMLSGSECMGQWTGQGFGDADPFRLLFGEEETALEARLGQAELARKGFLLHCLCTGLCHSAPGSNPPKTRLCPFLGWALSPLGLGCSPPQAGSVPHSTPFPGAWPPGPGSGRQLSGARALP